MTDETSLQQHYTHGGLEAALLAALMAAGRDIDHLSPADLGGADEFHIGGAQATKDLAAQLSLTPGMRLLDIGSGLGGPARHLAEYGCRVVGIDLTPEFVAVANSLTRRMGLSDRVDFRQASADRLDFADSSFDGATLLHVGMNVPDKAAMFAAVHRALKPGGFFAVYDVMRMAEGTLDFPVPWSSQPETSHVETPAAYRAALTAAGFTITAEQSRHVGALAFFAAQRARAAAGGNSPLNLSLVLGPTGPAKIANMIGMITRGLIAPYEMIARRG